MVLYNEITRLIILPPPPIFVWVVGLGGKSHGYRPMKLHFITFKASESTGLFGKPRTQSIFRDGSGKLFLGKFRPGFYFCLRVSLIRVGKIYMEGLNRNPKKKFWDLNLWFLCWFLANHAPKASLGWEGQIFFSGKIRTGFYFCLRSVWYG